MKDNNLITDPKKHTVAENDKIQSLAKQVDMGFSIAAEGPKWLAGMLFHTTNFVVLKKKDLMLITYADFDCCVLCAV